MYMCTVYVYHSVTDQHLSLITSITSIDESIKDQLGADNRPRTLDTPELLSHQSGPTTKEFYMQLSPRKRHAI